MTGTTHAGVGPAVTFLYEDADLLVIDKPPGVTVVPAGGPAADLSLRDRVAAAVGTRVWVVHRVDRDTSGVVVFARSAHAHRTLSMAFEAREVVKRYRALVAGVPDPPAARIDVAVHEARRGKARPARPGERGAKAAATSYQVTRVWRQAPAGGVASLEATPHTGRHHQIRVHLRSIGTPILGDAIYGRAATLDLPVPRLALHASAIDVPHPTVPDRRVIVESPWPDDLAAVTRWLDAQWTVVP
jgi:tRNA pseudouridine32 synthase / 23S rRNA pseudouridine746 synthase